MAYGYRLVADTAYGGGHAFPAQATNTNNRAEYFALGFGLKKVVELLAGAAKETFDGLHIYGDSALVVNQVNGEWDCNKDHLRALRDRCREQLAEIKSLTKKPIRLAWVGRADNEAADLLSREAYAKLVGQMPPERRPKARPVYK
jgi:ribonuclease HI